jgi:hypothetical protein
MSKSNHDLRAGAVASVVNDPDVWTYHEKRTLNIQGTDVNQSCIHRHTPDQRFTRKWRATRESSKPLDRGSRRRGGLRGLCDDV